MCECAWQKNLCPVHQIMLEVRLRQSPAPGLPSHGHSPDIFCGLLDSVLCVVHLGIEMKKNQHYLLEASIAIEEMDIQVTAVY